MTDEEATLFGTAELTAEQQAQRNELAAAGAAIRGQTEAAFDTDLDITTAEVRAGQLVATKDRNDAELSYTLHTLRANKAFLNAGYDTFQEYVESKLKFSVAKANNLATRWEHFLSLGLSTTVFSGEHPVSWSKFGELIPGIKSGIVDSGSIDVWLPMTTVDGPYNLTNTGISKLIKAEVADQNAEEDPDQTKDLVIKVTADDKAYILRYIDTLEQATGLLGAGEVVRAALEAKVTDVAMDNEDVRKTYGVVRLIEIAQHMAPGIQFICLASEASGYTEENLGVVPISKLYQDVNDRNRVVVSASREEAEALLGTEIDEFDISVAGEEPVAHEEPTTDVEIFEDIEDSVPLVVPQEPVPQAPPAAPSDSEWEDVGEFEMPDFESMGAREINTLAREFAAELIQAKALTKAQLTEYRTGVSGTSAEKAEAVCTYLINLANENNLAL